MMKIKKGEKMGGFWFIQFLTFCSIAASVTEKYNVAATALAIIFLVINCAVVGGIEKEYFGEKDGKKQQDNTGLSGFWIIQFFTFMAVVASSTEEWNIYGTVIAVLFLLLNSTNIMALKEIKTKKIIQEANAYYEAKKKEADEYYKTKKNLAEQEKEQVEQEIKGIDEYYASERKKVNKYYQDKIQEADAYYKAKIQEADEYYNTQKNLAKQEREQAEQEIKGIDEYYTSERKKVNEYYITQKNLLEQEKSENKKHYEYYQDKIQEADAYYEAKIQEADEYYKTKQMEAIKYYHEKMGDIEKEYHSKRREAEELLKEKQDYCIEQQNFLGGLKKQIKNLKEDIRVLEKKVFIEYAEIPVDENISSEEYKNELSILKLKEKDLIKSDKALVITSWDKKRVLNNNIKQILRCFNAETSIILNSVTVKNIDISRNKIQNSFETLNRIFETDGVALSYDFLNIKFEQMRVMYSYMVKKEEEREIQRAIKEQMLEEQKVLKEIEREKTKLEKEEKQFKNEINKLMSYVRKSSEIEKQLYIDKIKELEEKLKALEKDKNNVLEREQNTRAGFVYVISNIGSFGENIYKIGMTRRLEPMERIKELSSASVPFEFDVHAIIFSEDAPKLEKVLHQTFEKNRVNKVNVRKEFFDVDIMEIEKVVKENHNATVDFKLFADAEEYRQSIV